MITINSNISVLIQHNIISFGYFMPMSHGLIKKAPQPLSYTSTSLFCKLPSLNLQTVQPPPPLPFFRQFIPNILTVTKFSVKISQSKFLVMTEKNIFVYTFLSLNISYFSLFLCKNCIPLKKVKILSKLRSCQDPLFKNLVRGSIHLSSKGGCTLCNCLTLTITPSFACCFTRNTLSTLLEKIMHFQRKTNFFFQLIAGRF